MSDKSLGESQETYVVAARRPWNSAAFSRHRDRLPGEWHFFSNAKDLTPELLARLQPRYVFFPHWSVKVPAEIYEAYECVCFHMTDVPYGRGGSPLQNLIVRGHKTTRLTALRMVAEMDAGPVYCKRDLSLDGSAQQIFERSAELVYEIIEWMIKNYPIPSPQAGEPVIFKRRTPDQSRLPDHGEFGALHDHIRMLDADEYPKAFLDYGDYRLYFEQSSLDKSEGTERVVAQVKIEKRSDDDGSS